MSGSGEPRKNLQLLAAAVAVALLATPAQAKATDAAAISIPSQDLDDALRSLAKQTGTQVIFEPSMVSGRIGPAISGITDAEEALRALLADSGLTYRSTAAGTFTILAQAKPAPKPRPAAEKTTQNVTPAESSAPAVEEIVVTAQRRTEVLQDVPISITVITGRKLDASSLDGVAEALNAVPAVATTETYLGGGTNIAIRGVGASFPLFAGSSAVSYYLDSAPFGLVKSAIGPDANVFDLERVEVLRGPQGTLYGASALNGVVRVLTHDPELDVFDVKARVSTATTDHGDNSYGGDATVNVPVVDGRVALRATAGHQTHGGWLDQPNRADANEAESRNYRLKLLARITENFTVGLDTWSSRFDADAPDLGIDWDRSLSSESQAIGTDYDLVGLRLLYQGRHFEISSVTSRLEYENIGRLGLDVPFFSTPGALYYSRSSSEVTSQEINVNSSAEGPWRWSFGGIYREGTEDLFQHFTVLPVPDIQYYDTSDSYAVYGQLTRLLLDERLEVTAGVRYFDDRISQRGQTAPTNPFITASSDATATTPRVVVTWHANADTTLYASYSEGFRSGFPQTPAVLESRPDFPAAEPDRLRNYEIGAKGTLFDGLLSYDAAAYHIEWQDIQLQLGVTINDLPYVGIVNGATAEGSGVDLSLALRATDSLTISPYVSWNDLHIAGDVFSGDALLYRDGDRPSNSPETTAGLALEYAFRNAPIPIEFSASANYLSSQAYRTLDPSGLLVQEGDDILIARAAVSAELGEHWTATLFGNNLGREAGTPAVIFPGVVPNWSSRVRPMTVGLQLHYRLR